MLRHLQQRVSAQARPPSRRGGSGIRPGPARRLCLESLEDRLLLSSSSLTGPAPATTPALLSQPTAITVDPSSASGQSTSSQPADSSATSPSAGQTDNDSTYSSWPASPLTSASSSQPATQATTSSTTNAAYSMSYPRTDMTSAAYGYQQQMSYASSMASAQQSQAQLAQVVLNQEKRLAGVSAAPGATGPQPLGTSPVVDAGALARSAQGLLGTPPGAGSNLRPAVPPPAEARGIQQATDRPVPEEQEDHLIPQPEEPDNHAPMPPEAAGEQRASVLPLELPALGLRDWNQAAERFFQTFANLSAERAQTPLWIRLSFWTVAVATSAVLFELLRQQRGRRAEDIDLAFSWGFREREPGSR